METILSVTMKLVFAIYTISLTVTPEEVPNYIRDEEAPMGMRIEMEVRPVYRVSVLAMDANGFVGDTREYSFLDKHEARAKANGWFRHLSRKGFEMTGKSN